MAAEARTVGAMTITTTELAPDHATVDSGGVDAPDDTFLVAWGPRDSSGDVVPAGLSVGLTSEDTELVCVHESVDDMTTGAST